ncbi:acyl-CoA dehydrogenase [Rhodococcus pyridinivorans KG-16]|uniref:Acyl-CoA dehydrogenase n=1 Tax=Rhodococcus pyridinivorans KG-16 TaxID=1441730 RepID=A0A0V9UE78_9NOCA|nr:acyl-CoA dehydrogenase family protein [Rhodococcus pyridinivorans]KSZ56092.1 acyl-CoA dehydrogenase [Rhodococcus pyridinivorans KG-16]
MQRTIFDEDHEAFRKTVRAFLDRHVRPRSEEIRAAHAIPRDVWLAAGEQGLLGLQVPEEHGGSGASDYRYTAIVAEEFAREAAALASCFTIHLDVNAPYLTELTTPEQRERWLPGFCSGEIVTSIAMTEPSGGSDLAALKTTAVADGNGWTLNGSKIFITNGYSSDLVIVAARTTPGRRARGISLFGVEAGTEGFSRGRKLDKVGQDESDTAELFFQDVHLDSGALIGNVDEGFIHMMQRLPQERLSAAIANIAHADQILRETLEYARERKAFGQAIGSFGHSKFLLAELVTKVEATQIYVDHAIGRHVEGELTATEAAKIKWWSAEVQNEVLDHCVQLWGGYGYMNEYRVARAWRDARVTKIWAGSNEIMKELIGRDLGL